MRAVRRLLTLPVIAVAVVALSALAAAPDSAQANNCQIEKALGVDHPVEESQDPRCIVLMGLGCDSLASPTTCVKGIIVQAGGAPGRVVDCVEQYHPLLNASACNDVIFGP